MKKGSDFSLHKIRLHNSLKINTRTLKIKKLKNTIYIYMGFIIILNYKSFPGRAEAGERIRLHMPTHARVTRAMCAYVRVCVGEPRSCRPFFRPFFRHVCRPLPAHAHAYAYAHARMPGNHAHSRIRFFHVGWSPKTAFCGRSSTL